MESHLLQMRGLKLTFAALKATIKLSHLLQMRGLKLHSRHLSAYLYSRIFYRCVD